MREVFSRKILLYNEATGQHENADIFRGESAYEAAVRLGLTTLTEEQWAKEYDTKRDQAIAAINTKQTTALNEIEAKRKTAIADADAAIDDIEQKGADTLASIPEDYTALTNEVSQLGEEIGLLSNYEALYLKSTFKKGSLNIDGQYTESAKRVYSVDYMHFDHDTTLCLDVANYGYIICTYNNDDDKTLISRYVTVADRNYNIKAGVLFRVAIYAHVGEIISESEVETFAKSITYIPEIINQIEKAKLLPLSQSLDFLRCFTSFTTIGDSLMAGFVSDGTNVVSSANAKAANNNWVSYMCSRLNRPFVNLAMGSSTVHNWRYADQAGYPETNIENANIETACYIVGLGVNDLRRDGAVGTSADVSADYVDNADSFYGNYDYVIRKLLAFNPYAKIFVFTIPKSETATNRDRINEAIKYVASLYDNVHCIDLYAEDEYTTGIIANSFVEKHYNPIAYNYMSVIVERHINRYIYDHHEAFAWVPYKH